MGKKFRVAIAGASGYAGAELVRLAAAHPFFEITAVTSEKSAGQLVSAVFPGLTGVVEHRFEALAPEALAERADAVFRGTSPHQVTGPGCIVYESLAQPGAADRAADHGGC